MNNILNRRVDPNAPLADGLQMQRDALAALTVADAALRILTHSSRSPVAAPVAAPVAPPALSRSKRGFVRADTRRAPVAPVIAGRGFTSGGFTSGGFSGRGLAPRQPERLTLRGATQYYHRDDLSRSFTATSRRSQQANERMLRMASMMLMAGSTPTPGVSPRVSVLDITAMRARAMQQLHGLSQRFTANAHDMQDGHPDLMRTHYGRGRGMANVLAL